MADSSRISVIVPAYNAEKYLEKCINSILASDYTDLEILIIDDGSADDTPAVCRRLQNQDSRIRCFRQEDKGVSSARNAGIEAATGDYLTFVDADDAIRPEMLRILMRAAKQTGADIVTCDFAKTSEAGSVEEETLISAGAPDSSGTQVKDGVGGKTGDTAAAQTPLFRVYSGEEYVRTKLFNGNTRIWSRLIRRECIGTKRFPEGLSIGEDMYFLLTLMEDTSVADCPEPLYCYYINPAGAMERPFTESYAEGQLACWERAGEWISGHMPELWKDDRFTERFYSIRCVSALLVAGKIALLPRKERDGQAALTARLQDNLRENARKLQKGTDAVSNSGDSQPDSAILLKRNKSRFHPEAVLPGGYGAKLRFFLFSPELYYVILRLLKGKNG